MVNLPLMDTESLKNKYLYNLRVQLRGTIILVVGKMEMKRHTKEPTLVYKNGAFRKCKRIFVIDYNRFSVHPARGWYRGLIIAPDDGRIRREREKRLSPILCHTLSSLNIQDLLCPVVARNLGLADSKPREPCGEEFSEKRIRLRRLHSAITSPEYLVSL